MSTNARMRKNIEKGQKVRCSRSGRYYSWYETVDDGKGGRIWKPLDYLVHNQYKERSKLREGPGWERSEGTTPLGTVRPGTTWYDQFWAKDTVLFVTSEDDIVQLQAA